MNTALVVSHNDTQNADLAEHALIEKKDALRLSALSKSTRRSYTIKWQKYLAWCNGRNPHDDETLALYATHLFEKGLAPGSIDTYVAAVRSDYRLRTGERLRTPKTNEVMSGIKREGRDRGTGQRDAVLWEDVSIIARDLERLGTIYGLQTGLFLRLCSGSLLRVSEALVLTVEDFGDKTVIIRHSKTDQEGRGEVVYICKETQKALARYLERAEIKTGPIWLKVTRNPNQFLVDNEGKRKPIGYDGIRYRIKKAARDSGYNDVKISTHSLRIGSAISLTRAGASLVDIQVAGRWKSPSMPAYYARGETAKNGAVARYKDNV